MDATDLDRKRSLLVKRLFTEIAPIYDGMNTIMSLGQDKRWRRRTVEMAEVKPGFRVLDLCTGTGEVALEAGRAVGTRGKVIGVDFCREMLAQAEEKLRASGVADRVEFVQGDALALPFEPQYFDAVTIAFGIRNLDGILEGFREIYRVLKPGRRMACLELSRPAMAGFRQLYQLYFDGLVPLIGRLRHGSPGPYDYLPRSLKRFPVRGELSSLIEQAGFIHVKYQEIMLGTAAIHTGVRM